MCTCVHMPCAYMRLHYISSKKWFVQEFCRFWDFLLRAAFLNFLLTSTFLLLLPSWKTTAPPRRQMLKINFKLPKRIFPVKPSEPEQQIKHVTFLKNLVTFSSSRQICLSQNCVALVFQLVNGFPCAPLLKAGSAARLVHHREGFSWEQSWSALEFLTQEIYWAPHGQQSLIWVGLGPKKAHSGKYCREFHESSFWCLICS